MWGLCIIILAIVFICLVLLIKASKLRYNQEENKSSHVESVLFPPPGDEDSLCADCSCDKDEVR